MDARRVPRARSAGARSTGTRPERDDRHRTRDSARFATRNAPVAVSLGEFSRRRLGIMLAIFCAALVVVAGRLVNVQVTSSAKYAAYDASQLQHLVEIPAPRGDLVDRDGNLLATSIPQTTIYADPHLVSDPGRYAAELAPVLGVAQSRLQLDLSEDASFVYLARQVDDTTAARVRSMKLVGIGFLREPKRFTPNGALAAPVLGIVGIDGTGLSGLEYAYQGQLAGTPGEMSTEEAPGGSLIPGSSQLAKAAHPGHGLVLSLDTSIQYEAEAALASEIQASGATAATAVVLDSHTGDVLAMASLQASAGGGTPVEASYNLATGEVFEPGSVMKVTTFAGALNEGIISPQTPVTVPPQLDVAGYWFHDAEPHGTETLSATDVLAQSSNIGTIEIAEKLGRARVDQYMRSFGFGEPTGLSFPGASSGILIPLSQWNGTTIGSDPIGQDAAVTALQVADAYNVIADDGVYVPPRLVDATIDGQGIHHAVPAAATHRVLTQAVASELQAMLERVVADGTGSSAVVPGYTVAGKTGTAQIPNPKGPGYLTGQYMATFTGFVPAQNPALTIVVSFQNPKTSIYGGAIAAPVFAQIARYALQLLGIPPPVDANGGTVTLAPQSNGTASTPTTAPTPTPSTTVPLGSDVTGG